MPLGYAELEKFYHDLACVAFGIAQTTRDCDLLCASGSEEALLDVVRETRFGGQPPNYRGNISPPLDQRWLRGGWTSHFVWRSPEGESYLDIFGQAPRVTHRWESEVSGFYAGPHTVAQMKRTNRAKDWPFVTAIGARLLKERDPRGWLHIYDEQLLRGFRAEAAVPSEIIRQRPALGLLDSGIERLRAALHAEMQFWHELDRVRLRIYEGAVRPYLGAVRKVQLQQMPITDQHASRIKCAERYLALEPLRDFGVERMIAEARQSLSELVNPATMQWLPDVRDHFTVGS